MRSRLLDLTHGNEFCNCGIFRNFQSRDSTPSSEVKSFGSTPNSSIIFESSSVKTNDAEQGVGPQRDKSRVSTWTFVLELRFIFLLVMIIRCIEREKEDLEFEIEPESETKNGFVFMSSTFTNPSLGRSFLDENNNYLKINKSKNHQDGIFTFYVEYDN